MNFLRRTTHEISARDERGQAMAEFAFVLPILALLLFAVIQFGIVFHQYITITDAARVGARKGATALHTGAKDGVAAATTAAKESAQNLDASKLGVTVTAAPGWSQGSDLKVTVTHPYSLNLLGVAVKSGTLSSAATERIE
jgi:Flp pilus assembly protein TadG